MTKERRRLKIIDNRRAVQNQMEERQRKRVEEERRLKELERLEEDHIRSRLKLIEEERLRMLREHATHLIGFLPKNLLQSNDFPHLGSSIVDSSRGTVNSCTRPPGLLGTTLKVPSRNMWFA
ncbi:meiosis-specific nuclear structural protein 1-like isoform X1 [Nilaparvata lugens]|nr:meiosis-specific nuclear structural protein 1-like isoform X1 [Nilaparvata lugens]